MALYAGYLDSLKSFEDITRERKVQLSRIEQIRDSDVIVISSAIGKPNTSIDNSDLMPIADQLEGLKKTKLDVILETPGGSGEITEDIVRLLRRKHREVNFIVPGTAKSAGTIMVMAGDEILMGSMSTLGPIDAQVIREGKYFSAEAFLEGLEKIKEETKKDQALNRAYIPILQAISPGEIESARNALKFGMSLATSWLTKYKFSHWTNHGDGRPVTPDERGERAAAIAKELGSHARWLSHGRSIPLEDLRAMGLKITNFEEHADLSDAIRRYYTLLRMSFDTNMFKIFETPKSQIYRFQNPGGAPVVQNAERAEVQWRCAKCNETAKIQVNLDKDAPIMPGCVPFPKNNKFPCPKCGTETDLTPVRMQLEAQTKKKIV